MKTFYTLFILALFVLSSHGKAENILSDANIGNYKFKFNDLKNCYISNIEDFSYNMDTSGNISYDVLDANGSIQCYVYYIGNKMTVARVNIKGYYTLNKKKMSFSKLLNEYMTKYVKKLKMGNNEIKFLENETANYRMQLSFYISECTDVWSFSNRKNKNCDVDKYVLNDPDGKCGFRDGVYYYCSSSECCSKQGKCGSTDNHCSNGCQMDYGKCSQNWGIFY